LACVLLSTSLLTGCFSLIPDFGLFDKPDAVPKHEKRTSRGNPVSYVVFGKRYYTMKSAKGFVERGIASWYGPNFHGKTTSSGEEYDMHEMTAAHTKLPLPTYVRVTNLENGKSTVVKVNDRGPFKKNRIIDLSYAAATKLDIVKKGTGLVEVRAITPGEPDTPAPRPAVVGTLFIQVGSFGNQLNAMEMQQRLSGQLGRPVRIAPTVLNGQRLHRVQVGPIANVDEADQVTDQINALGIGTFIVIE
jgi:rare lipoprotein A